MLDRVKKYFERRRRIKDSPGHSHAKVTTLDLLKQLIASKIPQPKESAEDPNVSLLPRNEQVNHIAVILDGRVEDVIRAQNRMTALLLSGPEFVEFDPRQVYPQIGVSEYKDGRFINAKNPNEQNDDNGEF